MLELLADRKYLSEHRPHKNDAVGWLDGKLRPPRCTIRVALSGRPHRVQQLETAVTSCAGAKGFCRRMLLGTP